MLLRIKDLPDIKPFGAANLIKEISEVKIITEERIIRKIGNELMSDLGKMFTISSACTLKLPFNYIAIECTDGILLDFILCGQGLSQLGTFMYNGEGLNAEYSDDKGNIYAVTEQRSYVMDNLL